MPATDHAAAQPTAAMLPIQAIHTDINTRHIYQREPPGHDAWQTPAEFDVAHAGDCEDYAIAYWHALRHHPGQARIAWCRRESPGLPGITAARVRTAHMVCLYRPPDSTDPLVLDVAADAVCPLSERPDLRVAFEFDAHGLYAGEAMRPAGQLEPWARVLARMTAEGAL